MKRRACAIALQFVPIIVLALVTRVWDFRLNEKFGNFAGVWTLLTLCTVTCIISANILCPKRESTISGLRQRVWFVAGTAAMGVLVWWCVMVPLFFILWMFFGHS